MVGFGFAKVPVSRCASGGRIRFAISYHRERRRVRQFFTDLAAAKKEALLVAQRIQSGMQRLTDLKPHDRENYLAACAKLIDTWLQGLNLAPGSGNSVLPYVNILFSFALEHDYLPASKPTASSQLKQVKVPDSAVEVFTPDEFRRVIHATSPT